MCGDDARAQYRLRATRLLAAALLTALSCGGPTLGEAARIPILITDTLPERSKVVDSISTSASCVGSNPTVVI